MVLLIFDLRLPGFACRLSCLPERKAGPVCSSVTEKAEADLGKKSMCTVFYIYDIL